MLRARIATAIALIAILGSVLLYAPAWVFSIFVTGAIGCALYELYRLIFPADRLSRIVGVIYGVGISVAYQMTSFAVPIVPLLIGGCFCVGVLQMIRSTTLERYVVRLGGTCFGVVYIALGLSYFTWLRMADHGRALVIMTISMVALSDTFAFMVGRTMGKRKLAAMVSPNKTVEGFVAGFAGSVAAALICRLLLWPALPLMPIIGLGVLIGFIAPYGDLIESAIKRAFHVKDSGAILPGHGGMLDRADAYIFSAPAVFYYVKYVMGAI